MNVDSQGSPEKRHPLVGTVVEPYAILDVIAAGGMGVVFKAKHKLTDRIVAMKLLPAELARDDSNVQRVKLEAKALAQLKHPNIITTFDFGSTYMQEPFIVMEYVAGESLKEILDREVLLPINRAVRIFLQVVDAMRYAHAAGILHRDLKPHNVMVSNEPEPDHVKVLDFGVAKLAEYTQRITRTGEVVGSPLYMSPEQCTGRPTDQRCDIYSIGVMMFETLTGSPPFRGENYISTVHLKCTKLAPNFRDVVPGKVFPEKLEMIVLKCLEIEPDNRYTTMAELKSELELVAGTLPKGERSKPGSQNMSLSTTGSVVSGSRGGSEPSSPIISSSPGTGEVGWQPSWSGTTTPTPSAIPSPSSHDKWSDSIASIETSDKELFGGPQQAADTGGLSRGAWSGPGTEVSDEDPRRLAKPNSVAPNRSDDGKAPQIGKLLTQDLASLSAALEASTVERSKTNDRLPAQNLSPQYTGDITGDKPVVTDQTSQPAPSRPTPVPVPDANNKQGDSHFVLTWDSKSGPSWSATSATPQKQRPPGPAPAPLDPPRVSPNPTGSNPILADLAQKPTASRSGLPAQNQAPSQPQPFEPAPAATYPMQPTSSQVGMPIAPASTAPATPFAPTASQNSMPPFAPTASQNSMPPFAPTASHNSMPPYALQSQNPSTSMQPQSAPQANANPGSPVITPVPPDSSTPAIGQRIPVPEQFLNRTIALGSPQALQAVAGPPLVDVPEPSPFDPLASSNDIPKAPQQSSPAAKPGTSLSNLIALPPYNQRNSRTNIPAQPSTASSDFPGLFQPASSEDIPPLEKLVSASPNQGQTAAPLQSPSSEGPLWKAPASSTVVPTTPMGSGPPPPWGQSASPGGTAPAPQAWGAPGTQVESGGSPQSAPPPPWGSQQAPNHPNPKGGWADASIPPESALQALSSPVAQSQPDSGMTGSKTNMTASRPFLQDNTGKGDQIAEVTADFEDGMENHTVQVSRRKSKNLEWNAAPPVAPARPIESEPDYEDVLRETVAVPPPANKRTPPGHEPFDVAALNAIPTPSVKAPKPMTEETPNPPVNSSPITPPPPPPSRTRYGDDTDSGVRSGGSSALRFSNSRGGADSKKRLLIAASCFAICVFIMIGMYILMNVKPKTATTDTNTTPPVASQSEPQRTTPVPTSAIPTSAMPAPVKPGPVKPEGTTGTTTGTAPPSVPIPSTPKDVSTTAKVAPEIKKTKPVVAKAPKKPKRARAAKPATSTAEVPAGPKHRKAYSTVDSYLQGGN